MTRGISQALILRIENGVAGDKPLDAEIECLLPQPDYVSCVEPGLSNPGKVLRYFTSGSCGVSWPPDYMSSLDAAARLAKRLLPGWRVRVQVDGDGTCEAFVENKGDFNAIEARETRSFAGSPERALVAAVLRGWSIQQEIAS